MQFLEAFSSVIEKTYCETRDLQNFFLQSMTDQRKRWETNRFLRACCTRLMFGSSVSSPSVDEKFVLVKNAFQLRLFNTSRTSLKNKMKYVVMLGKLASKIPKQNPFINRLLMCLHWNLIGRKISSSLIFCSRGYVLQTPVKQQHNTLIGEMMQKMTREKICSCRPPEDFYTALPSKIEAGECF